MDKMTPEEMHALFIPLSDRLKAEGEYRSLTIAEVMAERRKFREQWEAEHANQPRYELPPRQGKKK
jgi:hypothetical protein